jgi:hypothetical protein
MHGGKVCAAVVGHEALHGDPVGAVEGHGTLEEAHRAHRLLVGEHLDVGKPRGVIDTDVAEDPRDGRARHPQTLGDLR